MSLVIGILEQTPAAGGGGGSGYPALLDVEQTVLLSGTSRDVVLPPSITAGNLIIITCANLNTTVTAIPAGFTQIAASNNSVYKRAVGGEGGTSVTFTAGTSSGDTNFLAFVINNVHASQAPELSIDTSSGSNADPPSVTASWGAANNLVLVSLNYTTNASIPGYPANCTLYREVFTALSMDAAVCGEITPAATFDPGAFSAANATYIVRTIIIRGA